MMAILRILGFRLKTPQDHTLVTYYYFTMTGQIRRRIGMRYKLRTLLSPAHASAFSSHFSCTALTDTKSQSRNNSPTVQHRKLRPFPETDPSSSAKPFTAAL